MTGFSVMQLQVCRPWLNLTRSLLPDFVLARDPWPLAGFLILRSHRGLLLKCFTGSSRGPLRTLGPSFWEIQYVAQLLGTRRAPHRARSCFSSSRHLDPTQVLIVQHAQVPTLRLPTPHSTATSGLRHRPFCITPHALMLSTSYNILLNRLLVVSSHDSESIDHAISSSNHPKLALRSCVSTFPPRHLSA